MFVSLSYFCSTGIKGKLLLIYIYNFHVLNHFLLIYICKLHWNKSGFIKAFSDQPESLTNDFGKIQRVLSSLFVKRMYLYPRFHERVISSFEQLQPDVIEISVSLTSGYIFFCFSYVIFMF